MSGTVCNYQRKASVGEMTAALEQSQCNHCGISAKELMEQGKILEVCGEEFLSDIATGERVLTAIALCPTCHKLHHMDAYHQHNPCQIKARQSREGLF